MRKDSWFRGALRNALILAFFGLLLSGASPLTAQFEDTVDVVDDDPGSPPGGNQGRRPGEGTSSPGDEGGMAPDVPTEQPKGLIAAAKRSLVKKIWNSLTAEEQELARGSLQDWLDEQGYSSCHQAAANPEESGAAAQAFLSSGAIQLTDKQRKWANRLLGWSSPKGTTTTLTIICNQVGL